MSRKRTNTTINRNYSSPQFSGGPVNPNDVGREFNILFTSSKNRIINKLRENLSHCRKNILSSIHLQNFNQPNIYQEYFSNQGSFAGNDVLHDFNSESKCPKCGKHFNNPLGTSHIDTDDWNIDKDICDECRNDDFTVLRDKNESNLRSYESYNPQNKDKEIIDTQPPNYKRHEGNFSFKIENETDITLMVNQKKQVSPVKVIITNKNNFEWPKLSLVTVPGKKIEIIAKGQPFLDKDSVKPGDMGTFSINFEAPKKSGIYPWEADIIDDEGTKRGKINLKIRYNMQ